MRTYMIAMAAIIVDGVLGNFSKERKIKQKENKVSKKIREQS